MSQSTTVIAPSQRTWFGQPAGLATLFFTEMWERFSYYGMRALLVLYLWHAVSDGGLGIDKDRAYAIYGLYTAGVYVFSVFGGWVADRLVGSQRAVLWGGIAIATGHLLLGLSGPNSQVFFLGLLCIMLGTGFLKPNVSALVAQIYPEGGQRRDAGFSIFYIGINVGALIAPLIVGYLHEKHGWHAGFGAAAVFMTIGVVQFLLMRHRLQGIGASPAHLGDGAQDPRALPVLLSALALIGLAVAAVWTGIIPFVPETVLAHSAEIIITVTVLYCIYLGFFAGLRGIEQRRIAMLALLFCASVLFWSGFEQAGSSFNIFADQYVARSTGWSFLPTIPTEWLQSVNSLFIVFFAPVFAALWVRLAARGLNPGSPLKFALGLLGMAFGFLVLALAAMRLAHQPDVNMSWLFLVYLFHTFGELCLSPVGLSAVSKLVPTRFVSQSLGIWFISLGLGNLLAGKLASKVGGDVVASMPGEFMKVFWTGSVSAVVLLVAGHFLQRWIGDRE